MRLGPGEHPVGLDLRRSYTLLASIPEQRGLPVTDFLTEKRQQIADRLKELKPLVEEHRPSRPPPRRSESWHRLPPPPPLAADRDARAEPPNVSAKQPQPLLRRPLRPPPRSRQHRKKRCGKPAADGGKAAARAPLRRCRPCRDSRASRSPSWRPRWGSRRRTSTGCCLDCSGKGRRRRKAGGGFRGRGLSGLPARVVIRADRRGGLRWARARRLTWPIPPADALSFVR